VYTTTPGWLGYDDEKLLRLTRKAMQEGFTLVKLKVGGPGRDRFIEFVDHLQGTSRSRRSFAAGDTSPHRAGRRGADARRVRRGIRVSRRDGVGIGQQPGPASDALEGGLNPMILDAHVHFWDPEARRHAWLDGQPGLRRRFGPEDYDAGRHEVGGMVFVQADCRDHEAVDEARWVGELMTRDPRVRGIVAYAPVHLGARAREHLTALAALPGIVGVRRLLQDEPRSVLTDPALPEGIRLLAADRLTFDLCIRHHQLRAVATLVAACPEVTFVLDHLGKPPVTVGGLDPWRDDLARLAERDHVFCKLSGLATEAAPGWSAADLRPYLDHALEAFRPERCMLGSDWPVSTLATTVESWVDVVVDAVAGLSPAERDAVLYRTARSAYRRLVPGHVREAGS
jgi:L-fuconolactonase